MQQASKPKRSNNVTNVELPLEACFDDPFATTTAFRVSEIRASIRERLHRDDRGCLAIPSCLRIIEDSADEINQLKSAEWSSNSTLIQSRTTKSCSARER